MHTDTRRLIVILLLGLAAVPLPVAYAANRIDATVLLPPDATSTPCAHVPSFAEEPTATPTPAATSTPPPTQTPDPTSRPASTPTPIADAFLIPLDDTEVERAIADQLNQQRIARGLPPLTLVSELTQAARRHSRDMADHGFTAHTGSDGSDGGQRMAEAGYDWTARGEIIGWGYGGDTGKMVNWWMNCPVHRPIILSSSFVDLGVGYVRDPSSEWGHYWTVNFGRRTRPTSGE